MTSRHDKKTRGFTIIELLVVISILGLISSIALANLQGARTKAKEAAGKQFYATLQRTLSVDTVAKWEFDEGVGNTALDSSEGKLNGEIVGAIYVPNGIAGSALSFDGNDYVKGDNFPEPGDNGRMTVAVWVRPTDISGANTILRVGDENCTALEVVLNGGKGYAKNKFKETPTTGNRVIFNNVWQNLAVVFDRGLVETYVDGTRVSAVNGHETTACGTGKWSIGSAIYYPSGYKGLMDSLEVYGAALTADQVGKIYARGLGTKTTLVRL